MHKIYARFWEAEMPKVIEEIKNALNSGASKLDVSGIRMYGNRQDYKADFNAVNGVAVFKRSYGENTPMGRPHEKDLWNVLPKKVKAMLRGYIVSFIIPLRDNKDIRPLFMEIKTEKSRNYNDDDYSNVFFENKLTMAVELNRREFKFGQRDINKNLEDRISIRQNKVIESKPLHDKIQKILFDHLVNLYGKNNVAQEADNGLSKRIDICKRASDGIVLYEIKAYNSLTDTIREAVGQLFEYGFFPNPISNLKEMIIVSQIPIDELNKEYLNIIRQKTSLNLFYQSVDLENKIISEKI